jgi:hypothetical protein
VPFASRCDWTFQAGSTTSQTFHALLVPPASIQGLREVKNFTLKFSSQSVDIPIQWALVHVPEGTVPEALVLHFGAPRTPVSVYEPNQNVIMSGLFPTGNSTTSQTFHSRLARNLQSGDRICFLVSNLVPIGDADVAFRLAVSLNFAITYYISDHFIFIHATPSFSSQTSCFY